MGKIDRRWALGDFTEMLAGMRDADELRTLDATGMTPSISAVLHAAEKAGMLMALLDTVEAGGADSALTRIEVLLEEQVRLQKASLERLDALVALLSTRARRQEALDRARADEDREIEAAREDGRRVRASRAKAAPAGSGG